MGKTALHFAAEQDARGPGEGNTVKIIQLLLDVRLIFAAHFFLRTLSDSLSELAPAGRRAARSTPGTTRATRRCSWPARSAARKRCSAPEPTQHASTTCGCKPLALVP